MKIGVNLISHAIAAALLLASPEAQAAAAKASPTPSPTPAAKGRGLFGLFGHKEKPAPKASPSAKPGAKPAASPAASPSPAEKAKHHKEEAADAEGTKAENAPKSEPSKAEKAEEGEKAEKTPPAPEGAEKKADEENKPPAATPAPKGRHGKNKGAAATPPPKEQTKEQIALAKAMAGGDPDAIEKAKYDEVRSRALADERIQKLREKADGALSEEEGRKELRAYNKALFEKMRALEPSISGRVERVEAAVLKQLDGKSE